MLKESVGRKHVIVRLDDSGGDLRSRGHSEGKLGLAAVVDGKPLEEKGAEARTSSSTGGVKDHEALKTSTVISELSDAVKDKVDNLLADGVVTTSIVIGSVFLSGDKLLRVVELAVSSSPDFIERSRLEIDENATRNVLAGTSLREKGVEGVITATNSLIRWHLSVRLNSVLKTVELPAAVTHWDACLTDVKGKNFSHFDRLIGKC